MLSKATFVRALRMIQEQADIMDAVRQQLGRLGEKPTYFNIDSLHLQALSLCRHLLVPVRPLLPPL